MELQRTEESSQIIKAGINADILMVQKIWETIPQEEKGDARAYIYSTKKMFDMQEGIYDKIDDVIFSL